MRKQGVAPNLVTFNSLLKVVASLAGRGDAGIAEARAVLTKIDEEGLAPDTITFNALLDICARTGDVPQLNPVRPAPRRPNGTAARTVLRTPAA